MKTFIMGLISFAAVSLFSLPANSQSGADEVFVKKFLNYKIKNRISTLKTAEIFARTYKSTPDQILIRFISTQFSMPKNSDLAVVYGLEAYQEQGLSLPQALNKISDLTGQMPSTLEAMNNTSKFNLKRDAAATARKKVATR